MALVMVQYFVQIWNCKYAITMPVLWCNTINFKSSFELLVQFVMVHSKVKCEAFFLKIVGFH